MPGLERVRQPALAEANPIPPDRTSWGTWEILGEQSLTLQHHIVENAATLADKQADPVARKIGMLYAAGMDEAAREAAGYTPIQATLDEIAALKSGQEVADYIRRRHAEGDGQLFVFGAVADFRSADMQVASADEADSRLPTKDYYTAAEYAPIRQAYLAYITRSFELTGSPHDVAAAQARDVLAFDSRLAAARLTPVEAREPHNQFHFVTIAEANKITPHFPWNKFFETQGVAVGSGFSLSQPRYFAALDRQLATAPIEQWRAYLRFSAIDNASRYLSKAFVDNSFEFYGKTLAG